MCCHLSPKGTVAVRVVVLIFSVVNFALLVTALAVPYVSTTKEYGTRVYYGLFFLTVEETRDVRRYPVKLEAACAAFEIIAVILSFVSAVLMVLLTVIQSKWSNGEEMWLDHEHGMAIAVRIFSVMIFACSAVALGLCGGVVTDFDNNNLNHRIEAGLWLLIPVSVLNIVNVVLCCANSCFGVPYSRERSNSVRGGPRRGRTPADDPDDGNGGYFHYRRGSQRRVTNQANYA